MKRTIRTRDLADCAGATMVETALSMILFLGIVIGLMNLAMVLMSYHSLSEAAREGARYAMVRGSNCTPLTPSPPPAPTLFQKCPASATDIQAFVQTYPGINGSSVTVQTNWCDLNGGVKSNCGTSSTNKNKPGNLVEVTATYTTNLIFPMFHSWSITMNSTSSRVITQ